MSAAKHALRVAASDPAFVYALNEHGHNAVSFKVYPGAKDEGHTEAEAAELAALIVRAVNNHDALVEALRLFVDAAPSVNASCHFGILPQEQCPNCKRYLQARAVIAKAEGPVMSPAKYVPCDQRRRLTIARDSWRTAYFLARALLDYAALELQLARTAIAATEGRS